MKNRTKPRKLISVLHRVILSLTATSIYPSSRTETERLLKAATYKNKNVLFRGNIAYGLLGGKV